MLKVWLTIKPIRQAGFSMVELLLAAAVFGILTTGLVGAVVYGRASTATASDAARAHLIAEEGLEATRGMAYASLVNGSYGLTQSGSPLTWTFLGSGTTDLTDIFTRQITITTAGTNRKTVTSVVTWPAAGGGTSTVTLTAELSNWPAAIKLWTNTATPVAPAVNDITGTNNAIKTAVQGNYAYTVLNIVTTNNFVITNISNPASPTSTAFSIAGTPTNIYVVGNYAYVTNQLDTAELQVVDITNPAAPSVVASVNMTGTGNGQGVYVSNGFAYVVRAADATVGANELTVVNVSSPVAPVVAGGYNNDALTMNEVVVLGTTAYIATSSTTQELAVINVTTPATPTLTVLFNTPTAVAATTIAGFGSTLLMGMGTTVNEINVITPATPSISATFTATGAVNDIDYDVTNKFAFLATASTTTELQILNITPTTLTLAKSVDVTGTTSTLGGVSYSTSYDVVVGASASDTQEILVFNRS
jgi:prepilin-type N-terminal cleavage/methylation domain-containing protein